MAQAVWAEITKRQSVRAEAYAPAWALSGFGLLLLACGAVATMGAYDQRAAVARLLSVAAGVLLCCSATWIAQMESPSLPRLRLMEVTGFIAACGALAVALLYLVERPTNGGPYAGALVALLPIAALTLLHGRGWSNRRRGTPAELVAWAALAIGSIALLYTGERSAVAALALGVALAAGMSWLTSTGRYMPWVFAGALGLLALALWRVTNVGLPGWLVERIALWQVALPLIGDYRFIGSGPGNTEMVFASYALLTHVPYVAHVHNLYLQVALEFGIYGLGLLLGMYLAALAAVLQTLRHGKGTTRMRAAAVLAALLASLLLGLVDSEVNASLLVAAIFVPLAAALLVHATARAEAHNAGILEFPERSGPVPRWSARPATWLLIAIVGILPVLLMWGISALPRIQAAWEANQGAVAQAQIELTDYARAAWPFQDAIRRDQAEALRAVQKHYMAALLLDPGQETAHRRMGQIELSLGDLTRAAAYLQEAHRLDPKNLVGALLLGEVRALQGDPAAAAALWKPLTMTHNQLETRLNWYRGRDASEELARMEQAVVLYNQLTHEAVNP